MTVTIAATANQTDASVSVSVAGLTGAYVTVMRNTPDGRQTPVRGSFQQPTGGSSFKLGTQNSVSQNDSIFTQSTSGWTRGANCASNAQSSTFAFMGGFSMKMVSTASGLQTVALSSSFLVTANQKYYASYWMYTTNSSRTATIEVDWRNSSDVFISSDSLDVQALPHVPLAANQWTQVTIVTTAPAAAARAIITISQGAQLAAEPVYVDDVSFVTYTVVSGGGSGSFSIKDSECPLNVPVGYTALFGTRSANNTPVQTGSVTTTSAVTINAPSGTVWLKNLLAPTLNTTFTLSQVSDVSRVGKAQVNYVVGRQNPVVIGDTRGGRTGTLTFQTLDLIARGNFLAILNSVASTVLLLQTNAVHGFEDLYFSITGDIIEKRPNRVATDPVRQFDVPFVEVDSPTDSLTSVFNNTYQTLLSWLTYQDMFNQRSTYLTLLNIPYGSQAGDTP